MSRRLRALALGAGLLLLAGCRADVSTDVTLRADGSGVVTTRVVLDAEAVAKVGDLRALLQLDDLRKAGWKVDGPGPATTVLRAAAGTATGGSAPAPRSVAVVASHPFRNVAQANALIASLSGPHGPYRGVSLTRSSGFAGAKLGAKGTIDLSSGLATFGDGALTTALQGRTVEQAAADLNGGAPVPDDAVDVSLAVVPEGFGFGGTKGNAAAGGTARVVAHLHQAPASFAVQGTRRHTSALLLAGLALLAAVAAIGLFVHDRLPGRRPSPPARRRQRHSRSDGWVLVQRRGGLGR